MGGEISDEHGWRISEGCASQRRTNLCVTPDMVTVTGTENLMMAAPG